jgi:hypothetical protein
MISIDDYKDADGKRDYAAYKAAKVAAGERCKRCSREIFPPFFTHAPAPIGPRSCGYCKEFDECDDEVDSDNMVRCPACDGRMNVHDDNSDWYEEGTHSVSCSHCGEDFEIETAVSYSFTSPARKAKGGRDV